MSEDEIVEAYLDVVCDGGTPVATCDMCGTTWYHPEGEYMEEGEFEKLQARHVIDPDECRPAEHAVSIGQAFGRQHVWDCRCLATRQRAIALWSGRQTVLRFVHKVNQKILHEAEQTAALLTREGSAQ